jgi:hypothetical protein
MLQIYNPTVEFCPIYAPKTNLQPCLRYNHDVDIVKFKGNYLASWNANEVGLEGVPGQYNFLSVSADFETWTTPERLFGAEKGCANPVDSDNQWQPAFINLNDETLFCAWCDMRTRRVLISESKDGLHWLNKEVSNAPACLADDETGFPTNHGIITSKGVLIFPCSLPKKSADYLVGSSLYAAMLLSFDQGQTWEWSEPIEARNWSEIGTPKRWPGEQLVSLWEPAVYERHDGTLELLVRNSTAQDRPEYDSYVKPEVMLLQAESSDGGRTWTRCRPVEIETTYSRNLTLSQVNAKDSLAMVMNDWPVNLPKRIPHDRYNLALYLAPGGDPDLMLPGPLVQPEGGCGFYPNGFVEGDSLFVAYTYAPATIMGAKVTPLPSFEEPFLLPRGGRQGLKQIDPDTASLTLKETTLGVVLSEKLLHAHQVTFEFDMQLLYRLDNEDFVLFTLGGKSKQGATVEAVYNAETLNDDIVLKLLSGETVVLGTFPLRTWRDFNLVLGAQHLGITVAGKAFSFEVELLKKFAFGGLYVRPEWPQKMAVSQDVRLNLKTLKVF